MLSNFTPSWLWSSTAHVYYVYVYGPIVYIWRVITVTLVNFSDGINRVHVEGKVWSLLGIKCDYIWWNKVNACWALHHKHLDTSRSRNHNLCIHCLHVRAWYDAVTVPIFWTITNSLPVSVRASNGSIYASTTRPGELHQWEYTHTIYCNSCMIVLLMVCHTC